RGKTVAGDLGRFVEEAWRKMGQPARPREALDRLLAQVRGHLQLEGNNGFELNRLLRLLGDEDFALPEGNLRGAILQEKDAFPGYLKARSEDLRRVETYLTEAQRRADRNDPDGAVRVLSSIVEEYPGRTDALRLVG